MRPEQPEAVGQVGTLVEHAEHEAREPGERTFDRDIATGPALREVLERIIAIVWERIERSGAKGRTVTLKLKDTDFHTITRARSFPAAVPDEAAFGEAARALLDALLPLMRLHGRIAVCGMVSQYNHADNPPGVKNLWQLVVNRVTMRGFLTYDHADRLAETLFSLP